MRRVLTLICVALLLALPVRLSLAAPVFSSPKALLEYAYKAYSTGDFPDDDTELYSAGLKSLFENAGDQQGSEDQVGPIDFDVFINAQDYQLTKLYIDDPVIKGDTATEAVSFDNFGKPQSMQFYLVKEDGSWRIDDIEALTGDDTWRLSELLADNPELN